MGTPSSHMTAIPSTRWALSLAIWIAVAGAVVAGFALGGSVPTPAVDLSTPQFHVYDASGSSAQVAKHTESTTNDGHQPDGRPQASAAAKPVLISASGYAAETETTTVGRWMSAEEHQAMESTGMVQPGKYSPMTDVANPADVSAYAKQAASGSRYVQFDVPTESLVQGGKEGWAHIPVPDSSYSRLNVSKGLPPYEYPPATNIQWLASKILAR